MASANKILQVNGVKEGLSSRDLEPYFANYRGKLMNTNSTMLSEFKYTLFVEFDSEENASKARDELADLKIAGIRVSIDYATPDVISRLRGVSELNKQNNIRPDLEPQKLNTAPVTTNTNDQNKPKELNGSDSKPKEKPGEEASKSRFTDLKIQTVSDIRSQYAQYNLSNSRPSAPAINNQPKQSLSEIKPYQNSNEKLGVYTGYNTQINQNNGNMGVPVKPDDIAHKIDPKLIYYNKNYLGNQPEYANTTTTPTMGVMTQNTPLTPVINSSQLITNGMGMQTLPYTNQNLMPNAYPMTMQPNMYSSLPSSVKPPQPRPENSNMSNTDANKMLALNNLAVDSLLASMQDGKNRGGQEEHGLQNPNFLYELLQTQRHIIETLRRQIEVKDQEIVDLKKGAHRRKRSRSRSKSKSRSHSRSRSSYSRRRRSSSRRRYSRSSSDDRSSDSRSNLSSDDSRRYRRRSASRRRSKSRRRSYSRKRSGSRRRSHTPRDLRQNLRSIERRTRYTSNSPRVNSRRSRDHTSRSPYQSSKDDRNQPRNINKSRGLSPINQRRSTRSRSRSYSRRNHRSYDRNLSRDDYKHSSYNTSSKVENSSLSRPKNYSSNRNEPSSNRNEPSSNRNESSKNDRQYSNVKKGDSPVRRPQSPRHRSPSPKPNDIIINLRPREFALHVQKEREAKGSDAGNADRRNTTDKHDDAHRARNQRSRSNSYQRDKETAPRPTFMEELFYKGNDKSYSNKSSSNNQNIANTNSSRGMNLPQGAMLSKGKVEDQSPSTYQAGNSQNQSQANLKQPSNSMGSQAYQGASGYPSGSNNRSGGSSQQNYKNNSTGNYQSFGSGQGSGQASNQNQPQSTNINSSKLYFNPKQEPSIEPTSIRKTESLPPVMNSSRPSSQQLSLEENKGSSMPANQKYSNPNITEQKTSNPPSELADRSNKGALDNQKGSQSNNPAPSIDNRNQSSQNQVFYNQIKIKTEAAMELESANNSAVNPTSNTNTAAQSDQQKKPDTASDSKILVKQEAVSLSSEGGDSKEDPLKNKGMQRLLELYIKNPNDERIKKMMEKVKSSLK